MCAPGRRTTSGISSGVSPTQDAEPGGIKHLAITFRVPHSRYLATAEAELL